MRRYALLAFLFLIPASLFAQGLKITGKVTDMKGEAIVGANVYIQSLNIGTMTDIEGRYTLTVRTADAQGQQVDLTASIVGSKKKSVKVTLSGETRTVNFQLEEDVFQTDPNGRISNRL